MAKVLIVGGGAIGTLFAIDAAKRLFAKSFLQSPLSALPSSPLDPMITAREGTTLPDRQLNDGIRLLLATRRPLPNKHNLVLFENSPSTGVIQSATVTTPPHDKQLHKEEIINVESVVLSSLQNKKFDLIVLALKHYDLRTCSEILKQADVSCSSCLTLSNGLGCEDEVKAGGMGCHEILAGVTYAGARLISPGVVQRTGEGPLYIQRPSKPAMSHLIEGLFPSLKFTTQIQQEIWRKLMVNSVINPLTAILQCRNGQLPDLALPLMAQLCEEFASICPFPELTDKEKVIETVLRVCEKTSENTSSMLADVSNSRRTEIDALNGALLSYAKSNSKGHLLPSHRVVYQLIKAKERSFVTSSPL